MQPEHHHEQADEGHPHDVRRDRPWGLLVTLIGASAIGWLGFTGQLGLYVHPRYFGFTLVMAVLGVIAAVAAFTVRARSSAPGRGWGAVAAALAVGVTMLVIPPATLTSNTAQQRSVNSGGESSDAPQLTGADPSSFSLRDWATLITRADAAADYAGQQVKLVGFVTSTDHSDPDAFYLTRFVITCCTVDAQPVGVPVAVKGWSDRYRPDQWLEVTGRLLPATDAPGGAVLVIEPSGITPVPQPAQPYEY